MSMPHQHNRRSDLTECKLLHIINLESFFELLKNRRVLRLQNISPLDKLPKTQVVHIESAPLHYYPLRAILCLGLAALRKPIGRIFKTGCCCYMMRFHTLGGEEKTELLPLLMPQGI